MIWTAQPPTDLTAVLRKEAVYTAIGRCSHRLKEDLNLVQWLDIAISEVKATGSESVSDSHACSANTHHNIADISFSSAGSHGCSVDG